MKFIYGEDKKEIIKYLSYDSHPKDLDKIWFNFAFIDYDSEFKIICSAYDNDRFPPGSIVVTSKIYNEFPIAQSAWHKNNQIDRMYVSPFYRNKKIATYCVITNDMMSKFLDIQCWSYIYSKMGGTVAGDQLYNKIYDLGFPIQKINIDLEDTFEYRSYMYPVIYFDKRPVYNENDL